MNFVVPPGGLAGFSQMTAASRRALFPGRQSSGRPSRRSRRKAARAGKRASRASSKRSRKLKFGSPAWQRKYRVGRFAKKRK